MDDAGDCRYPDIFPPSAAEAFDSAFDISGSEQQVDDDMLSAAHFMLRPFMLRRVKADVEKTVPPKEEIKVSQSLPRPRHPAPGLTLFCDAGRSSARSARCRSSGTRACC